MRTRYFAVTASHLFGDALERQRPHSNRGSRPRFPLDSGRIDGDLLSKRTQLEPIEIQAAKLMSSIFGFVLSPPKLFPIGAECGDPRLVQKLHAKDIKLTRLMMNEHKHFVLGVPASQHLFPVVWHSWCWSPRPQPHQLVLPFPFFVLPQHPRSDYGLGINVTLHMRFERSERPHANSAAQTGRRNGARQAHPSLSSSLHRPLDALESR